MSVRVKLVISVLSCLLTMLASGDDFCFARLVFLPTEAPAEPLPLDDPNMDFVQSSDSGGKGRAEQQVRDDTSGAQFWAPAGGITTGDCLRTLGHHRGNRNFSSGTSLNSPLRC